MAQSKNSWRAFFVVIALVTVTLAAFRGVRNNEFINFDDPDYVSDNAIVQQGLTRDGITWAFSGGSAQETSNWHPITWLSHMLDCEISGEANPLNRSVHHSTSLVIHAVNAALLFILLHRMTGRLWRAACVAAIFALHPLRVESVAWIAERKDVLSALFGMLALLAYVRYVGQSEKRESTMKARAWYWLSVVLFALGLMSKPMLVTLPFVLLLLDFWPLNRWTERDGLRRAKFLLVEKLPFFALTLGACAVTIWAQKSGRSIQDLQSFPLEARLSNAFISCLHYLGKLFWPDGLAVFYPHPKSWPAWQALGAVVVVACVTFAAVKWARRWPFLFTGWLWFLGTLVPVAGLVQVGAQSMADRYTYIPLIGVVIALVWGLADIFSRSPKRGWIMAAGVTAVLAACLLWTPRQVALWKNSETLYRHALRVTKDNFTAHENLGIVLGNEAVIDAAEGRLDEAQRKRAEAMAHFFAGIQIHPEIASAHHNLGNALKAQGKFEAARAEYLKATEIDPNYPEPYMNLGFLAVQEGDLTAALDYYAKAAALRPRDVVAQFNLGSALLDTGHPAEAALSYLKVLELSPNHVPALYQLGLATLRQGKNDEANQYFKRVLQLDPDHHATRQILAGAN